MTEVCPTCGHDSNKSKRSLDQNRLQHMWYREAAEQLKEYTADGYRSICKLTLGVPILRVENDEFKRDYDEMIRPLNYEQKIRMMTVPFDFRVTSRMSVMQKKDFLDAQFVYLTGLGAKLTEPDDD